MNVNKSCKQTMYDLLSGFTEALGMRRPCPSVLYQTVHNCTMYGNGLALISGSRVGNVLLDFFALSERMTAL